MKQKAYILMCCMMSAIMGNAQFAPPAGQPGSTAIAHDSPLFVAWASGCTITRGYQDISNPNLGYANYGESTAALGVAGDGSLVSLGDGGSAILTFDSPITNAEGWDFAVFENGMSDDFLEFAFVEVSSDGINFFRFPATSNTQDTIQTSGFGSTDATKVNNLAGKYRALYGTPFDLEELEAIDGLDINAITHIKIIDVVGCIQEQYATHDQYGHIINDPWSTPFPSSGFDLDAVGVIHTLTSSMPNEHMISSVRIAPNPIKNNAQFSYYLRQPARVKLEIRNTLGSLCMIVSEQSEPAGYHMINLGNLLLPSGLYFFNIQTETYRHSEKFLIEND